MVSGHPVLSGLKAQYVSSHICVRGTRTQSLISVGCSVHYWVSCTIYKRGFLRLHLCRHTFASLWGACLRFASLWRANSRGDSCVLSVHLSNVCWGLLFCLRKAFIFQTYAGVCYSVFVKRSSFKSLLNLRKPYIFQEFAEGLLSICVCWIFQSVHLSNVCWSKTPWVKFHIFQHGSSLSENVCDSWSGLVHASDRVV